MTEPYLTLVAWAVSLVLLVLWLLLLTQFFVPLLQRTAQWLYELWAIVRHRHT